VCVCGGFGVEVSGVIVGDVVVVVVVVGVVVGGVVVVVGVCVCVCLLWWFVEVLGGKSCIHGMSP
jgi:hypothetical protein